MTFVTLCPHCNGKGGTLVLSCPGANIREIKCNTCQGTGQVTLARKNAILSGERMRADRLRRGLSQSEEANRLGITLQELSHRELGRE